MQICYKYFKLLDTFVNDSNANILAAVQYLSWG
jgi:hypothetical protein